MYAGGVKLAQPSQIMVSSDELSTDEPLLCCFVLLTGVYARGIVYTAGENEEVEQSSQTVLYPNVSLANNYSKQLS